MLSNAAGAFCAYEGWVRDTNEGKNVAELHYTAYARLAPSVARAILDEAAANYALVDASVVHRTGVPSGKRSATPTAAKPGSSTTTAAAPIRKTWNTLTNRHPASRIPNPEPHSP